MAKSTFAYVTYIGTTPENLWSALTAAEFMKQYWFGVCCKSQWRAGSSWKMVYPDGRITDDGEIAEAEAPLRTSMLSMSLGLMSATIVVVWVAALYIQSCLP